MGLVFGGRYEIIRLLGKGGFGETYLARDKHCQQQTCVVKKLAIGTNDPLKLQIARRLFAEEARSLCRLGKHAQIPQLLAYFEDNQEFYLVQEFVDGRDLSHEIKPGKQLSEAVVLSTHHNKEPN